MNYGQLSLRAGVRRVVTLVHVGMIAPSVDIALVRQLLAYLTDNEPARYRPGYHRKPHMCVFCRQLYTATSVRAHVGQCSMNPRNQSKRWIEKRGHAIMVKPWMLREMLYDHDILSTGSQGAD